MVEKSVLAILIHDSAKSKSQHVAKRSVSICICRATLEQRNLFSVYLCVFYFNPVFAKVKYET